MQRFPIYLCTYTCTASPIINESHHTGAFGTTDKSTLTQHHRKYTVCLWGNSWSSTFYGFGQMYDINPSL